MNYPFPLPDHTSHQSLRRLAPVHRFALVIDDSPTIRAIVEGALRLEGYETRSFPDGIAAMKWLVETEARTPNLMVIDIGLPKIDGYEVIRRFKTKPRFANMVCIVLSRRDGMVDKLKGRLAGAKLYLTKPFTIPELLAAVRAAVTERCSDEVPSH